jgi:hypothetical protein
LGIENVSIGWSVGSLVSHDDVTTREGEKHTEPIVSRKLFTRDNQYPQTTCLERFESQSQITTDVSGWKLAAATLNWWILLSEGLISSLSSVHQRVQFEILASAITAHPPSGILLYQS